MVDDGEKTQTSEVSSSAAEEAFSLIANETRMQILRELWEADNPLSFSALQDRVGMRDSGQFNYHLNKLTGQFITKTETDDPSTGDGYILEYPGIHVLGAVYSGALTREASVGPISADGDCFDCGGDLVASYDADEGLVACTDCDRELMSFPVPPAAVEGRTPDELPKVYDTWTRTQLDRFTSGFCPLCSGPVSASLTSTPTPEWEDVEMHGLVAECERCGFHLQSLPGTAILSNPRVMAFHLDHGIDLATTPLWDIEWLYEPHTNVHDHDLPRFEVHVDLGDETQVVAVDADLQVTETERTG